MNDKDMKEFDKWHDENIANPPTLNELINKAWIGACEYKQKEIDELLKQLKHEHDLYKKHLKVYEDENAKLIEQNQIISQEIKTYIHIADRLKGENAKLKECVEFYANHNSWQLGECVIETCDQENYQGGKRARQVLKELEDK